MKGPVAAADREEHSFKRNLLRAVVMTAIVVSG